MALLEAHGLVKFYGRRCVVDGVNFDVNAGEVVGLLGPNGAGKTTSFKMTMGFTTPNGGKVIFNGHDVTTELMYRRARIGMGYLPQETSVFRKLTAEQNITAILEMVPMLRSLKRAPNRSERRELTEKMLQQFGLTHVRHNVAARLSGGEKRRLEIARCLVCEPLLILMDEPFTGIDPKTIHDIQQVVKALRDQGIGILLTDHNVREALKITTRSYLIKDGKVRTHGTPYQIVNDPIAISEYLGAGFNDDSFARNPDEQAQPALAQKPTLQKPTAEKPITIIPPPAEDDDDLQRLVEDGTYSAAPPVSPPPAPVVRPVARKPRPAPVPQSAPLASRKELEPLSIEAQQAEKWAEEKPESLVEHLKTSHADLAATALVKKGTAAVPALLAALERRDAELRRLVWAILTRIQPWPIVFDPYAQEAARMKQLTSLRDSFQQRKAG